MLEVGANGPGQNDRLQVASFSCEVGNGVSMAHPGDFLVENWTLIEILGDVVGGGTDDLDPSVMCLPIGIGPDERGEEGVVNVDDARLVGIHDEW